MRKLFLSSVLAFGLIGCTASQINTTNTIATDAAAVVADLTSAEAQLQTAGVSSTDLAVVSNAIAKVNADIANLGTSAAGASTILTDINNVISEIEPFAPEIAALLGVVAAPAPGSVHLHLLKPATLSSLQADYSVFKTRHAS